MFKSILVPTDGSRYAQIALRYGGDLARLFEAKIYLLYVIDIRVLQSFIYTISPSIGLSPLEYYQARISQTSEERGKKILEEGKKWYEERTISCETILVTGVVSDIIVKEAFKTDLVIMGGRGEHAEWGGRLLGSTLESVVRQTNKPVLVTSENYHPIESILVAYDGSKHANRALGIIANWVLKINLPLVVLIVSDVPEKGEALHKEAQQYLEPYQVAVKFLTRKGEPGEEIVKTATEENCWLIAMGAYGHSKIRELILGSTTEEVIRKAEIPVLLYR